MAVRSPFVKLCIALLGDIDPVERFACWFPHQPVGSDLLLKSWFTNMKAWFIYMSKSSLRTLFRIRASMALQPHSFLTSSVVVLIEFDRAKRAKDAESMFLTVLVTPLRILPITLETRPVDDLRYDPDTNTVDRCCTCGQQTRSKHLCGNQPQTRYCSVCKLTTYCSKECQKKHWMQHRSLCSEAAKYPLGNLRVYFADLTLHYSSQTDLPMVTRTMSTVDSGSFENP